MHFFRIPLARRNLCAPALCEGGFRRTQYFSKYLQKKEMKILFDYVGYRVLRWNRVRLQAKNDSGAFAYYTLIQGVLILDILAIIVTENYTSNERYDLLEILEPYIIIPIVLLYIFNIFYFKNKYAELENKWGNENIEMRTKRGRAIVICFAFIFLFWIFYLNIRGNPLG